MDPSPPIPEEHKRRIQQIVGKFLYYAYALDCTIMKSLNKIIEQQVNQIQNTEAAIKHLLDYIATNPSAIVQYKASDRILHIESDAS